jgi:hypothetical protein
VGTYLGFIPCKLLFSGAVIAWLGFVDKSLFDRSNIIPACLEENIRMAVPGLDSVKI